MTDQLDRLAELAGIENGYWDIKGSWHETPRETKRALLEAMGLELEDASAVRDSLRRLEAVAIRRSEETPRERCLLPNDIGLERAWGVACQVYGLRSERNAGIGDLEDMARFAEQLAPQGADFLGLSPLHALFPSDPTRYSPYAPSSRRWLNTLFIAIDAACREFDVTLPDLPGIEDLRRAELVDYSEVTRLKGAAFEELWNAFWTQHLTLRNESALGRAYLAWRSEQGEGLELYCRFEALAEHVAYSRGRPVPWPEWPAELRSPGSEDVARFAQTHDQRVGYFAFLQWLADRQLAAAQLRARQAGMRVGLYRDLAVGVAIDGADTWADPTAVVRGATIGAPPDAFSPAGQNWNVAPLSPLALLEQDFAALLADLRANMRHSGAIRVDHVMGLMRVFWIPEGGAPGDGAYVRYPFAAMLSRIAGESRREGSLVIGEELGTVPEGFTPAINEVGILSCRVAWFQRHWDEGSFMSPGEYEPLALASISTHDLPTVRGFFEGRDIDWRLKVGQYESEAQAEEEHRRRREEAGRLLEALRHEGVLATGADERAIVVALHRFLARSASALVMIQPEDLAGELEQANLPGTVNEHPNWRRRLPCATSELVEAPLAREILRCMREERPR